MISMFCFFFSHAATTEIYTSFPTLPLPRALPISVGWPTVFVRLTGCPLRCHYCDTAYAFHGGQWQSLDAIVAEVARLGAHHVCVTGGEPLAQKNCLPLLQRLCDAGHRVSLETRGAIHCSPVDPRVVRWPAIHTPASRAGVRTQIGHS